MEERRMAGTKSADRRARRARRHIRVRKKMSGTSERPRLVVFRSLRNMEGQLVDDDRYARLVEAYEADRDEVGAVAGRRPTAGVST